MIQVHSLQRAGADYVLNYTDPNNPDHAPITIYQGTEQQVRDLMTAGGLTPEVINDWFSPPKKKWPKKKKK